MRRRHLVPDGSFGFAQRKHPTAAGEQSVLDDPNPSPSVFGYASQDQKPSAFEPKDRWGARFETAPVTKRVRPPMTDLRPADEQSLQARPESNAQKSTYTRLKIVVAGCLVGATYLFGATGLWADYRSFDDKTPFNMTPAGHGDSPLPITPIKDGTGLRDAGLSQPNSEMIGSLVRPQFRSITLAY